MIDLSAFDSEQAAFTYCVNNQGQTLYVPAGEFDVSNLTFPHNTNMRGEGKLSILRTDTGPLSMPNSQGGNMSLVAFMGGELAINAPELRSFRFDQVRFEAVNTAVNIYGASYYNVWDTCTFYKIPTGIVAALPANDNHMRNCRCHMSVNHVKFLSAAHSWTFVGNSFEGCEGGAGIVELRGKQHHMIGNRHERYKANRWSPAAIWLRDDTSEIIIDGGRRCYSFSVLDEGVGNEVRPVLRSAYI